MSRVFTDENLLTWEVYASGGRYGLPDRPRVIFQCLSEPNRRARFVWHEGDEADAEEMVHEAPEAHLRELLGTSGELD